MEPSIFLNIKKIAIIGAGPAGITTAKYLKSEAYFDTIDIFEQRSSLGGLWNYSSEVPNGNIDIPQTNPNQPPEEPIQDGCKVPGPGRRGDKCHIRFPSPMYERLETNIPHFLMEFSDRKLFEENQLFPSRESTLQYLFNDIGDVQPLVQFETQVLETAPCLRNEKELWRVKRMDLISANISESLYDAVVVASGHYAVPYVPDILGIREWNREHPGVITHSKIYRRSQDFVNKKVIIVGYSASGQDIASHIATYSKLPVLISQRSNNPIEGDPTVLQTIPEIKEFLPQLLHSRAIRCINGHVETDIDAIVFCTGYLYSYPFLTNIHPRLIDTGERVQTLYQHLFCIDHPTLVFIGLPKPIVPFPTFESQAAVVARVWSTRLNLPSKLEMRKWEESVIAKKGTGKKFHDLGCPGDFDYYDDLVEWALQARKGALEKVPPKMNARKRWARVRCKEIKHAFSMRGEKRHDIRTMEELGFHFEG